jgi:general secretion pathway protein A
MYTAFFGLQRDPFTISPDPRYLFLSERHREALAHLLYGAQGPGGIVLLTGDIGAGKTTICRRFLEQAPGDSQIAYIFNPRLNVIELLQSIADEFGITVPTHDGRDTTVKELVDPLNRFLLDAHAAGRNPILIIDEAQNLSPDVLEQLRLLTNLETNERKLLQIVLIGQPELRAMLARPGLEQLSQRIVARFHLGPLDEADTARYIEHRMGVAGLSGPPPFTARALRRVHALSGGVPRRINLLCGRALLGAYAQGQREVGPAVIDRSATEVFGDNDTRPQRARWAGWLGAGVVAGVALASTVLLVMRLREAAGPVAAPAVAQSATAQAATPANAALAPPPPATIPLDRPPQATDLMATENEGWRAIGSHWGFDAAGKAPCPDALAQGLQCYRTSRMTLHGAQQMDRPALLRLHLPDGSGWAVLEGVDGERITLSAYRRRWTLDTESLRRIWEGEYLSLWRLPPGQLGRLSNGMAGPAARWLDERLTDLQQGARLDPKARSLPDKVAAFQRSMGIDVDGRATSTTMILINRASGVEEPRLATAVP